jgi:hypothetical protein
MNSKREALQCIMQIRLLKRNDIGKLFSDSIVYKEKLMGLTKSYIAIK